MRQPESTDAKRLAEAYFGAPARITPLGGGFYGRVFLAEAKAAQAVVKLYMKAGFHRKEKGQLPGDTVVATVMSNLGLHVFAGEHGLKLECTSVGDRNVLERMQEKGYVLGGEQSGHMIFLDYATTGDGQLTALQVLALLKESGKKASEVFSSCARYPQVLINVPVASNDVKKAVMASDALWAAVRGEEEQLAGSGRVLVRPSGTEALMRVMVEAKTEETAQAAADRLAALIPGLVEC